MSHIYEWEVQVADSETGEVVHCDFCESLAEAVRSLKAVDRRRHKAAIVLVREDRTVESNRLAYASLASGGDLPAEFTGEDGEPAGEVPEEFHEEAAACACRS